MLKNLRQIHLGAGPAAGLLVLSTLVLQGCSSSSSSVPSLAAVEGAKAAQQPIACNPSAAQLPLSTSSSILTRFGAVMQAHNRLSTLEKDTMFVDRDIKGNRISYATDPDAPTIKPWALKDLEKDGIPGTSTERAEAELGLAPAAAPVIVAVIDSAVDVDHEALKDNIWTNDKEDPSYPGAVNGWNFLGGKNGNIYSTTLELTREVKRMRALKAAGPLTDAQQAYLDKLETDYETGKGDPAAKLAIRTKSRDQLVAALEVLRANCLIKDGTVDEIEAIQSGNDAINAARKVALQFLKQNWTLSRFKDSIEHWTAAIAIGEKYYYNLDFDSSSVVGDRPEQMEELYGNADVKPQDAEEIHATHVSGIIGAVRGKHEGVVGQATDAVRIMSLRAVPDGDERDKDIGNAIKFAVDHGARVINMSFGKGYSPHREYVWQMLKYAAAREVLIVHAAGNDSLDNDVVSHYPDREVRDDNRALIETIPNVLEVGASSVNKDKDLPASFSDFGSRTVDLFAPGVQIYATVPGNHYKELDGTSMATPEVAGVAALVLAHFPHLTAVQLKEVLTGSATSFKGLMVVKPGEDPSALTSLVDFSTLSQTGGILNAFAALKAAIALGQ